MSRDFDDDFKLDFNDDEPLIPGDFDDDNNFALPDDLGIVSDDMLNLNLDDSADGDNVDLFNWKVVDDHSYGEHVSRRPEKKKKKKHTGLVIALIIVILIAAAAGACGWMYANGMLDSLLGRETVTGETASVAEAVETESASASETAEETEAAETETAAETEVPETETPAETEAPVETEAPAEYALENYLPSSGTMTELKNSYVQAGSGTVQLDSEAAEQVEKLLDAAKEAGYTLKVEKGYRDDADASSPVDVQEHSTGYAVDITETGVNRSLFTTAHFPDEVAWVMENAADYGFVLSLKEEDDGDPLTYHYVYVGEELAQKVEADYDGDMEHYVYLEDYIPTK